MTESKPSKSARKRQNLALQELGERLLDLSTEQIESLDLPQNLLDAVTDAARIRSRGAMRRQRQLIGKLMRGVDPDPIRRALDEIQLAEKYAKTIFRQAEAWRDRLVRLGREDLNEFYAVTGTNNTELESLLTDYAAASHDTERRVLRRRIFRLIHADLAAARDTIRQ